MLSWLKAIMSTLNCWLVWWPNCCSYIFLRLRMFCARCMYMRFEVGPAFLIAAFTSASCWLHSFTFSCSFEMLPPILGKE